MRQFRYRKYAAKCRATHTTILSNNCLAGVVYNSVSCPFLSPTINLTFEGDGFYQFVLNLEKYRHATLLPLGLDTMKAKLVAKNAPEIVIDFVHYHTWQEAEQAFYRRMARINHENIVLLLEARFQDDLANVDAWLSLPYRKYILTAQNPRGLNCIESLAFYRHARLNQSVVDACSPFGRRWIDEFDWLGKVFGVAR